MGPKNKVPGFVCLTTIPPTKMLSFKEANNLEHLNNLKQLELQMPRKSVINLNDSKESNDVNNDIINYQNE